MDYIWAIGCLLIVLWGMFIVFGNIWDLYRDWRKK